MGQNFSANFLFLATMSLHPDLQAKLAEYRQKRAFNPEAWAKAKCEKLNEYMRKCGLKACAVSVSGGVDSAVTAALCKYAQKMEGSPIQRVVGVSQPIHSSAWALNRATTLCTALGVEQITVDQTEVHTQVCGIVEKAIGITGKDFARGQMRSYMRTRLYFCTCCFIVFWGVFSMFMESKCGGILVIPFSTGVVLFQDISNRPMKWNPGHILGGGFNLTLLLKAPEFLTLFGGWRLSSEQEPEKKNTLDRQRKTDAAPWID